MADDPDRGLDSDDMLRAAREGIAKPPPTPEDDSSKTPDVQTEATEPNLDAVESTHPDRSQTPMVTSCEIHRTGNLVVNMAMETGKRGVAAAITVWDEGGLISRVFGPYIRARRSYELIFEGQEAAQITTSLQPAETWRGPSSSKPGFMQSGWTIRDGSVRETRVFFANSPAWVIRTVKGARTRERQTSGEGINRVITVLEDDQQIASSDGQILPTKSRLSSKGSFVAVAAGRRFTLSLPWKARQGTINEQGTLRRDGRIWSLSAREPVPLSVVLLYWHVLLGDWRPESKTVWDD
jgi:hypothetical protein